MPDVPTKEVRAFLGLECSFFGHGFGSGIEGSNSAESPGAFVAGGSASAMVMAGYPLADIVGLSDVESSGCLALDDINEEGIHGGKINKPAQNLSRLVARRGRDSNSR